MGVFPPARSMYGACTSPAGHTTLKLYRMGTRTDRTGRTHQLRAFRFDAAVCGACPLREQCVGSAKGSGRTVSLHPQEAMLQRARALQKSEGYAEYRQRRVWWSTGWRVWYSLE